jgi:DNA replication protein DnaC
MNMTIIQCQDCSAEISVEELELCGRRVILQKYCEECCQKRIDSVAKDEEIRKQKTREGDFWSHVPPLYRNTDISRINPILAQGVIGWKYNPIGIGIRGESGSQKTRAAVALLHKLHMSGKSVMFLKAIDITRCAAEQFSSNKEYQSEALSVIRKSQTTHALLIDDLGKGRLSPAAEELLYDILDKRSERELPVIWTANATASQLHGMMSEDRGDAIMRRLAEFTKVIAI